jgi:hypothetical protein
MSQFKGKVVGQVLETKDYSIFKGHPDNRIIRPTHVKKLVQKMKSKGWLKSSCIKVNQKYQIIDGHHRILAAVESGVPVRYEVVIGSNSDDIFELNSTQLKWSPFDHIDRFVKKGNPHYTSLSNFINKFPDFKITECTMFCHNNPISVDRSTFESGNWVTKNVPLGEKWASNIIKLKEFFPKGYNKALFVRSMIRLFVSKPEFNFEQFLHKVQMRPGMIHLCGSHELYIEMIEEVYNYKSRSKVNLRF